MFGTNVIDAAKKHAVQEWPRESVGFVVACQYEPQINISATPTESFEVAAEAWAIASQKGKIQAVIHSHPVKTVKGEDGIIKTVVEDYPNAVDMQSQINSGVPWGILTSDGERASTPFFWGDGVPVPPLTGQHRSFRHGVTDCYSLVRDYYREVRGITLKEFPRDWNWWDHTPGVDGCAVPQNLYAQGFALTGFHPIPKSEMREGDLLLFQLPRVTVTCHGGIYLGGSGDMLLHHLCSGLPVDPSRVATIEPGTRWLKYVTHYLRHEEMM